MIVATQNHVIGLRAVHSFMVNKRGPDCVPSIMDATVLMCARYALYAQS